MTTGRSPSGEHQELLETLRHAQRFGVLGSRPVEEAVVHAQAFVGAVAPVRGTLVDLGSGGGLPGLVIAIDRPDLEVVLVDRRQKRTDLLERAVARLDLADRVTVRCADARHLDRAFPGGVDAVTARGFGPPATTLAVARRLVAPHGRIVISEPPTGDRWDPEVVASLGLEMIHRARVVVFRPLSAV